MIFCTRPLAQYETSKAEIDAAVLKVLAGGHYILGEEVRSFESEFASYIGVGHCIGVGSGTEALHVILAALEIGPGDEVITVSHTAVATVAAIVQTGAKPVFADISPESFNLDPRDFESKITAKTKAVILVHLYGQPANITEVLEIAKKYQLQVIEDCAQAHGATVGGRKVGSFGDAAAFSFYPTKNLGAIGDGGAVVTRSPEIAERVRLIRQYGWAERYVSKIHGWNSRLDEMQAAILRVKLKRLDHENERRREIAAAYNQGLAGSGVQSPSVFPGSEHVYHLYVIRCERRDELQKSLSNAGVQTLVHYPVPVHQQPAYLIMAGDIHLPHTENAAKTILSLPMYPYLSRQDVSTVIEKVREYAFR